MPNTVNDSGTDTLFCAETVPSDREIIRENRALWRGIEAYIQREFMALSDGQMEAAGHAYRSCLMAHLPEYQCDTGKRVHAATLARFATLCGSP